MELISGTFLFLVGALAAGCLVAAVVLWPRVAGSGVRPLLARSGILLASQVTLTAALVLLTNKYFVFYATWNDLLGPDTVEVKVNQVQPSRGEEAVPSALVHRTTTDLGPKRRGHDRVPARDGRVDRLEIRGARSGLDSEAYVYLPPQYFQPAYDKKRLPVVVLISGGPSDDRTAWIRQASLPEAADTARTAGRAQPMIYAMVRSVRGLVPSPRPPAGPGADTGLPRPGTQDVLPAACLDLPGHAGGQAETYFAQDLPLALAGTYRLPRTRGGWGIAGFATGGQCAARLAMLHSDRFAAAASINGQFNLPTDGQPAGPDGPGGPGPDPYGGSRPYRLDNDLFWRLEHLAPPPVAILAAAGTQGPDAQQASRFASLAKPPMQAGKTLVPGAPQTLRQWRGHLPAVLEWLSAHLRGE